jgi:hypothetical protein
MDNYSSRRQTYSDWVDPGSIFNLIHPLWEAAVTSHPAIAGKDTYVKLPAWPVPVFVIIYPRMRWEIVSPSDTLNLRDGQ